MGITIAQARMYRAAIVKAAASLPDEDASVTPMLFPRWSGDGVSYEVGMRVCYEDVLYKVLQNHTSQPDWAPDIASSLFARVLIPDPEIIPEWEQPESTNPYMMGDKVRHNGKIWVSDVDNNVWEPGVYGWSEVEEN